MVVPVTSGLVLDLAASSLSLDDGQSVSFWENFSPDFNNALATGTPPTFQTGMTPTGGPSLRFSDGNLILTDNAIFDSATSAEIFVVVKNNDTRGMPALYQFGGSDFTYFPWVDGKVYDGSFTSTRYSYRAPIGLDWHIYGVSHDGTTRIARIDDGVIHVASSMFTPPTASGHPTLVIGPSNAPEYSWNGEIAEFVAYSRALTEEERTQVYNYLITKHITVIDFPVKSIDVPEFNPIDVGFPNAATVTLQPMKVVSAPTLEGISLEILAPNLTFAAVKKIIAPAFTDIGLDFGVAVPVLFSILSSTPSPGSVLPINNNIQFNMVIQADDPNTTAIILVSESPTFDRIVANGTAVAEDTEGNEPTTVTVQGNLESGVTYYWKYVLLIGEASVTGSEVRSFTVNPDAVTTTYTGSWTVVAGISPPTIWFIYPAGGQVGDKITIYGQGIVSNNTHVNIGNVSATIDSMKFVNADPDIPPIIDETSGTVTVAHDEIVILVPDINHPGGELTVTV